jgi:hypothetical protein
MTKSMLVMASALACILVASAYAQTATAPTSPPPTSCKAQATGKKLAGAALTSFMKKCESDATKACDTAAADKKLAGAAKTSFTKKCVSTAVGN